MERSDRMVTNERRTSEDRNPAPAPTAAPAPAEDLSRSQARRIEAQVKGDHRPDKPKPPRKPRKPKK